MTTYLKSAIDDLYGKNDDFILLGLTGRTGSGCSTVAKILQNESADQIKHSLYFGDNPENNGQRKQKIIKNHFEKTWAPFNLIKVRSVLTLFLANEAPEKVIGYTKKKFSIDETMLENFKSILEKTNESGKSAEQNKSFKDFYTKILPNIGDEIKQLFGESLSVKIYQQIGKNVRSSGCAINEDLKDGKFFTLIDKINEIVKKIRDEIDNNRTLIVIDAIRHPLEAIYFQERYAAFFLMAISCDEIERYNRLISLGYNKKDIETIDETEYSSKKLDNDNSFSVQDIQGCLQRADLYIHNPNEINTVSEFKTLANQVISFVSLMKRPGLVTPSPIERCMQIANTAKLNSGCISRQVGAVVTDSNFVIKSIGWNDVPHGQVPCNLRNRYHLISGKDQLAYSNYEKNNTEFLTFFKKDTEKYKKIERDKNVSYCFKSIYNDMKNEDNQVHTRSLHAEENAFLQISKYGGIGLQGGNLFTTASPCELCAKKAYQLGVKNIDYIDPYPGIALNHILEGGSNDPKLILFSGAIGRAFHQLYTPIVSYKDELNTLAKLGI